MPTTTDTELLIRTDLWSSQLKDFFEDQLIAQGYVRWLSEFPDGDTFHIPSIGQAEAQDYDENQAVSYSALDTGEFLFQVTEYKQSGHYITKRMMQDSFYANELMSSFVPLQARALAKQLEVDILRIGPERQTVDDENAINGVSHRWVGTGVDGAGTANHTISIEDFARARLALQKANVPMDNLIAIVDPSVEFSFNKNVTLSNSINATPMWASVVTDAIATGLQFRVNIMGFDVYVSQNLKQGLTDTIHSETVADGVANLMFSAAPNAMPLVGAVRQPPMVDGEYNKDYQRDEFVTTTRYGVDLYRPENFVVVLTDNTISTPSY